MSVAIDVARDKIDLLMSFSLTCDHWDSSIVSVDASDYVTEIISYMKVTFSAVKSSLDAVGVDSFCFGCCGHVASRLMGCLVNGSGKFKDVDNGDVPIAEKVNVVGIWNFKRDVEELRTFADGTDVAQLGECFKVSFLFLFFIRIFYLNLFLHSLTHSPTKKKKKKKKRVSQRSSNHSAQPCSIAICHPYPPPPPSFSAVTPFST